jgi:hypothetical protein
MSGKPKEPAVTDRDLMHQLCQGAHAARLGQVWFIRAMENHYGFSVLPKAKKKRTLKLVRV